LLYLSKYGSLEIEQFRLAHYHAKKGQTMRWLRGELPDSSFERFYQAFKASSLKTRLMIFLIPSVLVILVVTAYFNYLISKQFISSAIERSSHLQIMAIKHEIESFLRLWREDVCQLAQDEITPDRLSRFLARSKLSGGIDYLGVSFISQESSDHIIFMANDSQIVQIPSSKVTEIKPGLLGYFEKIKGLALQEAWLSPIIELEYPFPELGNPNQKLIRHVLQMAIPCRETSSGSGYLMVMVDALALRNILSLYNSSKSPIWAFPRTAEERYFYLFDTDGWILFQSDQIEKPRAELSTHLARSGYTGTLGRQGLESAFRPDSIFDRYWKVVEDVREGRHDTILMTAFQPNAYGRDYFLAYAPILFKSSLQAKPQVVAGVAYMDISRLNMAAGYKHIEIMLIVTLATAVCIAGLIFILGGIITRPILKLAEAVKGLPEKAELTPIELPYYGKEITALQGAINSMIATVKRQMEEIRLKDQTIRSANLKEQAFLGREAVEPSPLTIADPIPSIVGYGPRIEKLKNEILKAAQTNADVLIIGETGTGKQLAAEAIHSHSSRAPKPFISINCGALDENLLLDTLFGHVKGAFTEAKTDRNGAFLEADQGTLFLDEIQVAAPRVQQALLRAIAVRKIKPLGSDQEIDVDVRLIVATNVDLKGLIERDQFREDLYFRLKVITIHTPPLREQKENIAALARHVLEQQAYLTGRSGMGLSKGALSKLLYYNWPGNVRELQNCITRAVVMAESQIIQAEDIPLDVEDWEADHLPACQLPAEAETALSTLGLNRRQQKAWAAIVSQRRITRSQYQALCGENLPARTAIYDLQDLVQKGILKKTGSGPATHYVLTEPFASRKAR